MSEPAAHEAPASGARWYCLRAQPKHEHIAAAHLQSRAIEVFCPRVRFRRSTRRGLVWFTEALFPNYLFARFELACWHALVRSCPGVSGVVHFGHEVPAVPERALEQLRDRMQHAELVTLAPTLVEGDQVEIVTGPFRGQSGLIRKLLPARERVKLLLEMLGGDREVSLPLAAIFKETPLLPARRHPILDARSKRAARARLLPRAPIQEAVSKVPPGKFGRTTKGGSLPKFNE